MATPSEALTKKCHTCQVNRPMNCYLTFSFGVRAGRISTECIQCWSRAKYPPVTCRVCNTMRPVSEFDKEAESERVCKPCLVLDPATYSKRCTKCKITRTVADFNRYGRTSYRYAVCKKCDTKLTIEKNRKVPLVVASRRRRHTAIVKMAAYEAYGGPFCACCGETEMFFLTLDHVNNDGAEWRRAVFGGNKGHGAGLNTYMWCKRNGYPPIFQVLCWNCQQGKRFNKGICPHRKENV